MKKTYFIILLLSITHNAPAQQFWENLTENALKNKVSQSLQDTNRVIFELALGRAILFKPAAGLNEIDSSSELAAKAEKLSRHINYQKGIANSLLLSALIYNKQGQTDKGLTKAQQALSYSISVNNLHEMAESYIIIGQHYGAERYDVSQRIKYYRMAADIFRKEHSYLRLATTLKDIADLLNIAGQRTQAVKALFEALKLYKSIKYNRLQGIYWLIGLSSNSLGDFTDGLKYGLLAVKTAKEVNDTTLQLAAIYRSVGSTLYNTGNYAKAINYFSMGMAIAEHFKNKDYIMTIAINEYPCYLKLYEYQEVFHLIRDLKKIANPSDINDMTLIDDIYLDTYTSEKQFQKAAYCAKDLEKLTAKLRPDDLKITFAYESLMLYYIEKKQIKEGFYYADRYDKIVRSISYPKGVWLVETQFFKLDSMMGDYKTAIKHSEFAQRLQDTMYNVTKSYQISLLQVENEIEKKENDIVALTRQAQLIDSELKKKQIIVNVIIIGAIFLIIIIVLVYSRYRIKQRSNVLLQSQKIEIDSQNAELQTLVTDKNQLLDEKDELLSEKDLLLREINHRVNNNLHMIISLLESQSAYLDNKAAQGAIMESQNRIQALALIHQKLYQIKNVTDVNMEDYISELVTYLDDFYHINEKAILIRYFVDHINLDISQAIPVGLILNELITNSIKHAFIGRTNGEIIISFTNIDQQRFRLKVADNGIGLVTEDNSNRSGKLGMSLVKGLTRQLRGSLLVESDYGFIITVEFSTEKLIALNI